MMMAMTVTMMMEKQLVVPFLHFFTFPPHPLPQRNCSRAPGYCPGQDAQGHLFLSTTSDTVDYFFLPVRFASLGFSDRVFLVVLLSLSTFQFSDLLDIRLEGLLITVMIRSTLPNGVHKARYDLATADLFSPISSYCLRHHELQSSELLSGNSIRRALPGSSILLA